MQEKLYSMKKELAELLGREKESEVRRRRLWDAFF